MEGSDDSRAIVLVQQQQQELRCYSRKRKRKNASQVELKFFSTAAKWQQDGCGGLDFLQSVGLQGLASVKWRLCSCSKSQVKEFIANFNASSSSSIVEDRQVCITSSLIASAFKLPNAGIAVEDCQAHHHEQQLQQQLFLASGSPMERREYSIAMLKNAALIPVFQMLAEVLQLKAAADCPHQQHPVTSLAAPLVAAISHACFGGAVNWAAFLQAKILKAVTSVAADGAFAAAPLVAHLLEHHKQHQQQQLQLEQQSDPRQRVIELVCELAKGLRDLIHGNAESEAALRQDLEDKEGEIREMQNAHESLLEQLREILTKSL